MRWKSFVPCILAAAGLTGDIAAQEPTSTPMFQQWVVNRTRFMFVSGRINNTSNAWMFGVQEQTTVDGQVREQIHLNGGGAAGSLSYSYQRGGSTGDHPTDPNLDFAVEISSEGRFVMRYTDKDHPSRFFNLTQVPGQPVSLSLPPADKPRVLHAPTIWHLVIINGDDCRKQLLPMLESVRPGWHVGLTAQSIEDELVKMSGVSRKSDRKQWEEWVRQLGDPVFMRRDRADQRLRDVGSPALGFLTRLNTADLDAEQTSRVRGIVRFLCTQSGEDTPQRVAATLVEDPLIWMALLSRPEEATRAAAAQQLAVILDRPIAVDPKADPATQVKAREDLRAQIEKAAGEVPRIENASKPASDADKTKSPTTAPATH